MEQLKAQFHEFLTAALDWLTSLEFYVQLGAIVLVVVLASLLTRTLKSQFTFLRAKPESGRMLPVQRFLYAGRDLLFLILTVVLLGVATKVVILAVGEAWLVRVALGLAVVWLFYLFISRFVMYPFVKGVLKWVGIPLAVLFVFGWLDDVTAYLDTIAFHAGNLEISLYDVGRTAFFGVFLFWLARISNAAGKAAIRSRPDLDIGTRDVVAKLFEVAVFATIFLLLVLIMGIKLTALAVVGGALALGLGFGLQGIVANFVAGFIILMDRSITRGDYIELEDGRAGRLRELNLRCATLETYDGKDLMVPNETFITSTFTNWTHNNEKQRYELRFSVAYDTDIKKMLELITGTVQSHPQVLSGPDLPDEEEAVAEIESFGDSAINIKVEFWIEGIDDGKNAVTEELNLMVWTVCEEHSIEMPFPQREIKILDGKS